MGRPRTRGAVSVAAGPAPAAGSPPIGASGVWSGSDRDRRRSAGRAGRHRDSARGAGARLVDVPARRLGARGIDGHVRHLPPAARRDRAGGGDSRRAACVGEARRDPGREPADTEARRVRPVEPGRAGQGGRRATRRRSGNLFPSPGRSRPRRSGPPLRDPVCRTSLRPAHPPTRRRSPSRNGTATVAARRRGVPPHLPAPRPAPSPGGASRAADRSIAWTGSPPSRASPRPCR